VQVDRDPGRPGRQGGGVGPIAAVHLDRRVHDDLRHRRQPREELAGIKGRERVPLVVLVARVDLREIGLLLILDDPDGGGEIHLRHDEVAARALLHRKGLHTAIRVV
jgi:hypothetical protein